jgi:hypothetical protein
MMLDATAMARRIAHLRRGYTTANGARACSKNAAKIRIGDAPFLTNLLYTALHRSGLPCRDKPRSIWSPSTGKLRYHPVPGKNCSKRRSKDIGARISRPPGRAAK